MKKTLLFLAAFLPSVLWAQSPALKELDILCVTEFPTTSFVGLSHNDQITVRMVNHNGVGYMPIHSGPITINDLDKMKERAEVLKNIPDVNEFSFKLQDCEVYKDGTFRCGKGTSFPAKDGSEIKVYSLTSIKRITNFSEMSFENTELQLYIEMNHESYFINMMYAPKECGVDYKFQTQLK